MLKHRADGVRAPIFAVSKVLGPEQMEALDKAEGKQSVVERLRQAGEQNQKQDKVSHKKQEQKIEL